MKIMGLEKALESVPEEEREELKKSIMSAFEDVDADGLPGEPVEPLDAGVKACPACGRPLEQVGDGAFVVGDDIFHILDCLQCDKSYSRPAQS